MTIKNCWKVMNKTMSIRLSIHSTWGAKILNGEKTRELRKRFPLNYRGWIYLYCTMAKPYLQEFNGYHLFDRLSPMEIKLNRTLNGKVVARFYCDNVEKILRRGMGYHGIKTNMEILARETCLPSFNAVDAILKGKDGYAIHISQLEIFDNPKEISEFYHYKLKLIDCGMDCPPYFDEVIVQLAKAPQSWCYCEERK